MTDCMIAIQHINPEDPFEVTVSIIPFSGVLEDMQTLVDGYIESLPESTLSWTPVHGIIGWCNDEGKLKGLPPTLPYITPDGHIGDVVVGNVLITGQKGPDTCPLTHDQCKRIADDLWQNVYQYSRFNMIVRDFAEL